MKIRRKVCKSEASLLIFQDKPAGFGTVGDEGSSHRLPKLHRASPSTSLDKKCCYQIVNDNDWFKCYLVIE